MDGIKDSMDMGLSKLWEIVRDREAWLAAVHGVTNGQTRLSDFHFYTPKGEYSLRCRLKVQAWVLRLPDS